jgi:hypothetical protein
MRRRAFLTGLGTVAAWPHIGRSKPHRIGFLSQQPAQSSRTFIEGLLLARADEVIE